MMGRISSMENDCVGAERTPSSGNPHVLSRFSTLFIVYMCVAMVADYRAVFVINCLIGLLLLGRNSSKVSHPIVCGFALAAMILMSLVVGLCSGYDMVKIIRDLVYYLMPFSYYMSAVYFAEKLGNEEQMLTALFFASFAVAIITFLNGISSGITSLFGIGSFKANEMIAYPIVLFLARPHGWDLIKERPIVGAIVVGTALVMVILTLSRATIIFLFIVVACICLYSDSKFGTTAKILFVVLFFTGLALSIVPRSTLETFVGKFSNSLTEMSSHHSWDDVSATQNWRGYELSCAIEQFESSDLISKAVGNGFGFLMPVNGLEYLVTDEVGGLNTLHNGYMSIVIKNGIFGLLAVVAFFCANLIKSYLRCKKNKSYSSALSFGITLSIVVCSYFITGIFSASAMNAFVVPLVMFSFNTQKSIDAKNEHGRLLNESPARNERKTCSLRIGSI